VSKRHRKTFDPSHPAPYELSRSRIENFMQCPACFYMQQVEGIVFPSIPNFNLNTATDILLKRDFDRYRGTECTHPYLVAQGYSHLIPFEHESLDKWANSMHYGAEGYFHTVHEETNLKIGGGLDDVYQNKNNNKLHIIDYKSTSSGRDIQEMTLDGKWKVAYKRQMDLYVWVFRRMGFDVDDTGYFLYVDGDRFTMSDFLGENKALMEFKVTFIPYQTDLNWIEPTLISIKKLLHSDKRPDHHEDCEHGQFLQSSAS
jgi:hypothetical protein